MTSTKKKKKEQEIVPVDTETSVAEVPEQSFADMLLADADQFKEHLTKEDMSVPFIALLQALSPACIEGDGAYVEGARPGMLIITDSGELYDVKKKPLLFQAIAYKNTYIEWVPRSSGAGAFVAEHSEAEGNRRKVIRNDVGEDIIQPDSPVGIPGNQLSQTHTHFVNVINKETGDIFPAVLALTSSQLKPSRNLNSMVNNLKLKNSTKHAQRFYGVWEISTELKTKGENKWQSMVFKKHGVIEDLENGEELYLSARSFRLGLDAGNHKVDYNKADAAEENPSVDPQVQSGELDEEIPF